MENLQSLIKHMEEGCLSTGVVEDIKNEVIIKASRELELYIGRLESELSVLQDFLKSLQYLVKHNNSCYSHLFEQGILELMKVVFKQILGRLPRDGQSENLTDVIELCTETSNVLADINTKAKSEVVLQLSPYFLDLLESHLLEFSTRLEVLKSTNMLLEQCPTSVKEVILNTKENMKKISGLGRLVKIIGDYEFQVGIIECLMRLFPRKNRFHFAEKFLYDQGLVDGFMAIKDKDFETDCRLFLNSVNAQSDDPSEGVFSLPCVSAFVGNKQLRKPSDGGYEEFWVDFNISSERLTLFCEHDSLYSQGTQSEEDLWETVAVYKTDVQQCCFNEKHGMIELEICLKSPVCDIYPSQHQDVTDNKIRIMFLPELEAHVAHAVGYTFNFTEKRNKVSTVRTPLQISMKDVQNADSQSKQRCTVQNQRIPSPSGSQESVSKRHKVSVPSVPMTTPAASPLVLPGVHGHGQQIAKIDSNSVIEDNNPGAQKSGNHSKASASINTIPHKKLGKNMNKVQSEETAKDFAVPKTPQRKTRSKVKTPVVTVTPPSRKTKKHVTESKECTDEKDTSENIPAVDEHQETVTCIPDSLPFVEANESKTEVKRTVKASVSKENGFDDSGIGADESRSTIFNTSVCEAPDTTHLNVLTGKSNEETQGTYCSKDKTSKKVHRKTSKKEVLEHSIIEENVQGEKEFEESVETNKTEKNGSIAEPVIGKTAIKDETKRSANSITKDNNFGFDSLVMEEQLDSVPDSLEVQSGNLPIGKSLESISRKDKYIRKKEGKVQSNIDKEEILDENDLLSENIKSDAGKTKEKSKKTFCDVDRSLKELKELDKNKDEIEQPSVEQKKKSDKCSKLEKIKKSGRPKQGKTKRNVSKNSGKADGAEGSSCDFDNRRHLRRRCRNSGEIEKSKAIGKNFSSLDSEADTLSKVISDKSEEIVNSLPLQNTPENSPDKIQVNERKIKSSLKKNRKTDNSTKEPDKRKSRVSFDLPISESQEKDQVTIQDIETPKTDIQVLNTSDSEVETSDLATSADPLKGKTKERTKEFNTLSKEAHSVEKRKSLNDSGANNQCLEDNEALIEKGKNEDFTESEVVTPVGVVSSPTLSTASSDSLYIERDDSYNARRYRMENKTGRKSKERRKSSLNRINKELTATNMFKDSSRKNKKEPSRIKDLSSQSQNLSRNKAAKITTEIGRNSDRQSGLKREAVRDEKAVNDMKQPHRTSDKVDNSRLMFKTTQQQSVSTDKESDEFDFTDSVPQSTESPGKDEDENEYSNEECTAKNSSKEDGNLSMNEEGSFEQDDCSAVVPCNTSQNYMHMHDDDFQENFNGKNKSSKKSKRKSLSYTVQSFEKMECEDGYSVSEQSFQTIADTKGKNTVFQMSYLKSQRKMNSKNLVNKNKRSNDKQTKIKATYDPYDFEAQCDNSSVASERINRKDMSKELNSRHRKTNNISSQKMANRDTTIKEEKSVSSYNSFSDDVVDERKCRNSLKCSDEEIVVGEALKSMQSGGKNHRNKSFRKMHTDKKDMKSNFVQDDGSHEQSEDVDEQDNRFKEKPKKTTLVQDKITKRWYRTDVDKNNSKQTEKNSEKQKKEKRRDSDFPTLDSFNKRTSFPDDDDTMIIDSSVEESSIHQFSKILQEISFHQGKLNSSLNLNISDEMEADAEDIKTPCIIGSISSTPKVGSGKRKHYYPLNISVIKTPQSCEIKVSDCDSEVEAIKDKKSDHLSERGCLDRSYDGLQTFPMEKRAGRRGKKDVKYKDLSESGSEDEKRANISRMSTDSLSYLDSSQNVSNRSEKSWILERRKTPKLKKSSKTYKANRKMKKKPEQNLDGSTESEDLDEDSPIKDSQILKQHMTEYLQHLETSPLTIPSLSLNTPAVTPSIKSLKSYEEFEDFVTTPGSPVQCNREKKWHEIDAKVQQENYAVKVNVRHKNSDAGKDDSGSGSDNGRIHLYSLLQPNYDSDEENCMKNMLQENLKLLGDSGFASGPSSAARPTRSALKRKFPVQGIEENSRVESSSSSQAESDDEVERSIFVPKKLFKFDPAVNTPQAPSLYSDVTDESDVGFVFQSGLSTVMAAFGADIQNHLKRKKQKIETFTKRTLKETQRHFHQTLVEQQQYQSNLTDEFGAKMLLEISALEKDIQRLIDAEKKMEDFFRNQFDVLKSNEESQKKRLSSLKKLQSSFVDKTKKVNKYNLNIHKTMQEQLKNDIMELQKRLIADTQRQEFMDVKTKLQKFF